MGKGWEEEKDKRFINPFNFVPLKGKCERKPLEVSYQNGLTGYIECVIKLLTPLFIPNTSNEHALAENLKCKSYDFFSYEDLENKTIEDILKNPGEPIIPASEIRGVVRSIHETIFSGCMSSIDLKKKLERRCPIPKNPALLTKENGKWKLIRCEKYSFKDDSIKKIKKNTMPEGKEVYFTLKGKRAELVENPNIHKGYLHIGEPRVDPKKRGFFVFKIIEEGKKNSGSYLKEETIELFEEILNEYKKQNVKDEEKEICSEKLLYKNDEKHCGYLFYRKCFDKIKNGEKGYLPVYYDKVKGEKIHLSPACIGREAYYTKMLDILNKNGEYQPCKERKEICPSCALFGMVSKEKSQAVGSRVRFEDARLIKKEEFNKNWFIKNGNGIVLQEMGEPRSGAVEFYTIPPQKASIPLEQRTTQGKYFNWTYDYINSKEKIDLKAGELQIRGRKFYWHSQPKDFCVFQDGIELSEMQQVIRPLNCKTPEGKEVEFKFRVYFENISDRELQELKLALDFDKDCAYKFGRAKPLGFGSAKIQIKKVVTREIEEFGQELERKEKKEIADQYLNKEALKTLKIILNWNTKVGDNLVQYPLAEDTTMEDKKKNRTASHLWFTGNRGNNSIKPRFSNILPKPEEEKNGTKGNQLYKLIKQMDISIKKEEEKEIPEVLSLMREAFWDVYKPGCEEHLITKQLHKSKGFIKELDFVAMKKGKIIANIVCSDVIVKAQDNTEIKGIICIGPIGVLPEYQSKRVGSRLMEYTIKQARKLGYKGIILYGNPDFYQRFGFINAENYKLKTSQGTNFKEFMALELKKDSLKNISGICLEDKAFSVEKNMLEEFEKNFQKK